jgi:hypothetical protein
MREEVVSECRERGPDNILDASVRHPCSADDVSRTIGHQSREEGMGQG